jgi:hypothetical protein
VRVGEVADVSGMWRSFGRTGTLEEWNVIEPEFGTR